jgi:hypothetical protein
MKDTDAVELVNFIPDSSDVVLRKGYSVHATGMTGAVDSLLPWRGPASAKLFAANGANIYNVTASGAVGAAVQSSLTNDHWQYVNFTTPGGSFLVIANGEDAVRNYDGTSWTTPTITGVTSSTLVDVNAFKQRLYFIEAGSTSCWYLEASSISGAAVEFDVGAYMTRGGRLLTMQTWTLDSGAGIDDLAVFITSEGQVLLYTGLYPGDASWQLVGIYEIGKPIGQRCAIQHGGDVIVITSDGVVPLSRFLQLGRMALSANDKIRNAFVQAALLAPSTFGWQPVFYPRGRLAFVNVPQNTGEFHQYVMNIHTGSWAKFTGLNASCWAIHNDRLYGGCSGAVHLCDEGTSDNGANITGDIRMIHSSYGHPAQVKHFRMVNITLSSEGEIYPALRMNVDYRNEVPTSQASSSGSSGSPWNTSPWNTSPWTRGLSIQSRWESIMDAGLTGSLWLRVSARNVSCHLHAVSVLSELGHPI